MMNQVAQLLFDALSLMPTKLQWTQGVSARDAKGNEVRPSSPAAVCFCTTGALARARHVTGASDEVFGQALSLLPKSPDYMMQRSVPTWNDDPERTYGDVLNAFDDAIIKAQKLQP